MKVFRFFFFLCLFGFGSFFVKSFLFSKPENSPFNTDLPKEHIVLFVDNLPLIITQTTATTVKNLLQDLNIPLSEVDYVWPQLDQTLASGNTIILRHSRSIKLKTSTDTQTIQTTSLSAPEFIAEQGISLDDNDILLPSPDTPLTNQITLQIIRVHIEEKTINQPIAFTTTTNKDDTLSWRKKIITQKGVNGNKALSYKIISYDGKEIQRKLLATEITQQPTPEIITQGTYVKVGKASTGIGSWYAFTGTLSAANPWLPIGSYVRVTNQDNGKQVIVRINDRGPFGPNRIIDLDKVAFQEIASLGTGVINVKMETIVN